MRQWQRLVWGAVGLAAAGVPSLAQAQGGMLKQGMICAIGFSENFSQAPGMAKGVATYRVVGVAGDPSWYRLRLVMRGTDGNWISPPGAPDVWVNLNYAMWVQEVPRQVN